MNSLISRNLLYFLGILCVMGCGFTPVYSNQKATDSLSHIEIGVIPDQDGQFLRNALIDRFYTQGYPVDPAYRLAIAPLQAQRRDLDVTITSDTTRAQMKVISSLTLTELKTNKPILKRSLKSITSYNVLGSEFATRVAEKNARENAIEDIARQIERALVLYLGSQQ